MVVFIKTSKLVITVEERGLELGLNPTSGRDPGDSKTIVKQNSDSFVVPGTCVNTKGSAAGQKLPSLFMLVNTITLQLTYGYPVLPIHCSEDGTLLLSPLDWCPKMREAQ